jgi:hypothetical protein
VNLCDYEWSSCGLLRRRVEFLRLSHGDVELVREVLREFRRLGVQSKPKPKEA